MWQHVVRPILHLIMTVDCHLKVGVRGAIPFVRELFYNDLIVVVMMWQHVVRPILHLIMTVDCHLKVGVRGAIPFVRELFYNDLIVVVDLRSYNG